MTWLKLNGRLSRPRYLNSARTWDPTHSGNSNFLFVIEILRKYKLLQSSIIETRNYHKGAFSNTRREAKARHHAGWSCVVLSWNSQNLMITPTGEESFKMLSNSQMLSADRVKFLTFICQFLIKTSVKLFRTQIKMLSVQKAVFYSSKFSTIRFWLKNVKANFNDVKLEIRSINYQLTEFTNNPACEFIGKSHKTKLFKAMHDC